MLHLCIQQIKFVMAPESERDRDKKVDEACMTSKTWNFIALFNTEVCEAGWHGKRDAKMFTCHTFMLQMVVLKKKKEAGTARYVQSSIATTYG